MSKTNKYIIISGAFLLAVMFMSAPAFADPLVKTDKNKGVNQVSLSNKSLHKRIVGRVVAIKDTVLRLKCRKGIIYNVDVSNAKIMKHGSAIILPDIYVGDTVAVVGVISGQNINATKVRETR